MTSPKGRKLIEIFQGNSPSTNYVYVSGHSDLTLFIIHLILQRFYTKGLGSERLEKAPCQCVNGGFSATLSLFLPAQVSKVTGDDQFSRHTYFVGLSRVDLNTVNTGSIPWSPGPAAFFAPAANKS